VSNALALSWSQSRNATGYQYCVDTTNTDRCDRSWVATHTSTHASLSGLTPVSGNGAGGSIKVTSLFFGVASDQATISGFGFGYDYSGVGKPPTYSCSGSGCVWKQSVVSPLPIGVFVLMRTVAPEASLA